MRPFVILFFVFQFLVLNVKAQTQRWEGVDFRKADSVASLFQNHSLLDLKLLANKLTTPLESDVEKFRSIYFWVCTNIENDYRSFLKNKQKRNQYRNNPAALYGWNRKFSKRVFEKLAKDKKTVCTGYAYLIEELSMHAGLSCHSVDGYSRSTNVNIGGDAAPNHTWNVVQLDGEWFTCDATWSSGIIDPNTKTFKKKFDSTYFLADPSVFIRNHYPLDTSWAIVCNPPSLELFLLGPIIFKGAYLNSIDLISPNTYEIFVKRGETVAFQFRPAKRINVETVALLVNNVLISQPKNNQGDDSFKFEHTFLSRGEFPVYILIDKNFIYSHTVLVR